MPRAVDVAVVGGGPAGLAAAIELARHGVPVRVFERQHVAPDKACGEGVMPAGVAWLASRGIVEALDPTWVSSFAGIRYVQDTTCDVAARFRHGQGLGIRRTALMQAMVRVASNLGIPIDYDATAQLGANDGGSARLSVNGELWTARFVVAADGLASPLRTTLGLDGPASPIRRFGQRRHFEGADIGEYVEVHWADGVEAYLTPTGPGRCGVAFLWEHNLPGRRERREAAGARFDELLDLFPDLRARFATKTSISEVRGAGPLARPASGCVRDRVILFGDAAGYVDAITGEGLSLAFASAEALGAAIPAALAGDQHALPRYELTHRRLFRTYARAASALVWLSRHPSWRRRALARLHKRQWLFEQLLDAVGG